MSTRGRRPCPHAGIPESADWQWSDERGEDRAWPSPLARGRPCSPLRMASTPDATPASGSGQRGGVANLLQVELAVPKQRLAQREPLIVVADGKLVGHAHAAVQLDGLAADETGRARRLHL